jgi:hypothetical protein
MNSLHFTVVAVLLVTLAALASATKVEAKKWVVPEFTSSTSRGRTLKGGGRMPPATVPDGKTGNGEGLPEDMPPATVPDGKTGIAKGLPENMPPATVPDGKTGIAKGLPEHLPPATVPDGKTGIAKGGPETEAPIAWELIDPNRCSTPQDEFAFNLFDHPCYEEAWGYAFYHNNDFTFCLSELSPFDDKVSPWFGDECRFYNAAIAENSAICNDDISSMVCAENYCDQAFPPSLGGGIYGTDYNLSCKLTIYKCCTAREDLPSRV